MRQFETMFLLSVRVPSAARAQELALAAEAARRTQSDVAELLARAQQLGLAAVRGCEVVEVRDEAGNLMNDFTGRVRPDERKPPVGTLRSITVQLDTAQYQMDVDRRVNMSAVAGCAVAVCAVAVSAVPDEWLSHCLSASRPHLPPLHHPNLTSTPPSPLPGLPSRAQRTSTPPSTSSSGGTRRRTTGRPCCVASGT